MDNKPTFQHNFKTIFGVMDIAGCNGYVQALTSVLNFLKEETEFNPDKRFIDSVKILERIENTNEELTELLSQEMVNLKDDITGVL